MEPGVQSGAETGAQGPGGEPRSLDEAEKLLPRCLNQSAIGL